MANYTIPQLYDLAIKAGFPPSAAPDAAATAWVESHGQPTVASGTGPVGLWQINMGNARALGFQLDDRLNPEKNAQMAYQLWKKKGGEGVAPEVAWSDWWPYDRNNAKKQKDFAEALATAIKGGASGIAPADTGGVWGQVGDTVDALNPLNALKALGDGFGNLAKEFASFATMTAWFANPANDIRVLFGVFGLVFLGAGLFMLTREVRHG
jgi:hypothetical protein